MHLPFHEFPDVYVFAPRGLRGLEAQENRDDYKGPPSERERRS